MTGTERRERKETVTVSETYTTREKEIVCSQRRRQERERIAAKKRHRDRHRSLRPISMGSESYWSLLEELTNHISIIVFLGIQAAKERAR